LIYFIAAEGTPYVKVGRTNNAKQRLEMLAVGCPYPLLLLRSVSFSVSTETQLEKRFHSHFAKYRQRGEWFSIDMAQIDSAIAEVEGGKLQPNYSKFIDYIHDQSKRHNLIGDLARDILADDVDTSNLLRFTEWRNYLWQCGACDGALRALVMAWIEYRRVRKSR
jgi:hypothetical protein